MNTTQASLNKQCWAKAFYTAVKAAFSCLFTVHDGYKADSVKRKRNEQVSKKCANKFVFLECIYLGAKQNVRHFNVARWEG